MLRTSFYVFIYHLYTLFGEIYILLLTHFLIKPFWFILLVHFESYKIALASIFILSFENNFVYIQKYLVGILVGSVLTLVQQFWENQTLY